MLDPRQIDHAALVRDAHGRTGPLNVAMAQAIATVQSGRNKDSPAMYAWNRVWRAIEEATKLASEEG